MPTEAELEVLKLFWREGDLSAREVHDRIPAELGWAVSTTRTTLERMKAKGLLTRRSVHGLAVYSTAQPKLRVIGGLVQRLRGVLEIDGPLPASAFSGSQILTEAELAELQAHLDGAKGADDGRG